MDYPNAELLVWTRVMMVLSICVVLTSFVNYLLKNEREQEIKSIFIGFGMGGVSLGLYLYVKFVGFDIQQCEGEDMTIWLCVVIPVIGGAIGCVLRKMTQW